jgi:hypothetical protein
MKPLYGRVRLVSHFVIALNHLSCCLQHSTFSTSFIKLRHKQKILHPRTPPSTHPFLQESLITADHAHLNKHPSQPVISRCALTGCKDTVVSKPQSLDMRSVTVADTAFMLCRTEASGSADRAVLCRIVAHGKMVAVWRYVLVEKI